MKKVFILLLVLCVICAGVFLGDIKLAYAITKTEFTLDKNITQSEKDQFESHMQNCNHENYDCMENNTIIDLLYNVNDEPEYLLVTKTNHGYSIYHRITGALLEKTEEGGCPYDITQKCYYLGFEGYAEKTDNDVIRYVDTKEEIKTVYKTQIAKRQKSLCDKLISKKVQSEQYVTQSSVSPTSTLPNIKIINYPDISLSDFTNVEQADKIATWNDINDFGANTEGSCEAVALTILLKYQDLLYGGIIPETAPGQWVSATAGHKVENSDNSGKYDCTINSSDTVFSALHKYLIKLSNVSRFGLNDSQVRTALTAYANELNGKGCINLNYTRKAQSQLTDAMIGDAIDANSPVKISIYSEKSGNSIKYHAAVAYGYYHDSWNYTDYFRIHSGWDAYSSIIINEEYLDLDGRYMYTLNTSKNSSHNIMTNGSGHACNNSVCYANLTSHRFYKSSSEYHRCTCNLLAASHYYASASTSSHHVCDDCGETSMHQLVSVSNNWHECTVCHLLYLHNFYMLNGQHYCLDFCGNSGACDLNLNSITFIDQDSHFYKCNICKNNVPQPHNKTVINNGSNHTISCNICGLNETFNHEKIYVYYNANQHRYQCKQCGSYGLFSLSNHDYQPYLLFFRKCTGCGHTKV